MQHTSHALFFFIQLDSKMQKIQVYLMTLIIRSYESVTALEHMNASVSTVVCFSKQVISNLLTTEPI